MSAAWAVATDTPFAYTKQNAGDYGGTRNGMVMHWPNGFKTKGEIRAQWHHVNDIAPTVLEAAKLPAPTMVNGVEQRPMDGVSMLYCLDDTDAADRHTTQYFEMFGNRAIYHDGWLARVVHSLPWQSKPLHSLEEDVWQLYDARADFSLSNDLSAEHPEKLGELKALFREEAIKNNVYPLDDRSYERFNAKQAGRPDLMGGRTTLVFGVSAPPSSSTSSTTATGSAKAASPHFSSTATRSRKVESTRLSQPCSRRTRPQTSAKTKAPRLRLSSRASRTRSSPAASRRSR
jgi:arylsulfatase